MLLVGTQQRDDVGLVTLHYNGDNNQYYSFKIVNGTNLT